jgi:hypothetical protein
MENNDQTKRVTRMCPDCGYEIRDCICEDSEFWDEIIKEENQLAETEERN